MRNYKDIDTDLLTLEDALEDKDWGKRPNDYVQYVALDTDTLMNVLEMTDDEKAQFINEIAVYASTGIMPEYASISSSAVRMTLRPAINSHLRRIEAEYLKQYRKHIQAMKKKQSAET